MLELLVKKRPWLSLRGVVTLLLGLLALAVPGKTLFAILVIYGAYALTDGIATLLMAGRIGRKEANDPWPLVFIGIFGVAAGLTTFYWAAFADSLTPELPVVTPQLVLLIAWAVARGLYEMMVALRLRHEIENESFLIAAGALSVIFGVLLALQIGVGMMALVWAIGLYGIVAGALYLALSFRLARLDGRFPRASGA